MNLIDEISELQKLLDRGNSLWFIRDMIDEKQIPKILKVLGCFQNGDANRLEMIATNDEIDHDELEMELERNMLFDLAKAARLMEVDDNV